MLEVPGRTSGEPRRTPVNVLSTEGKRYLVSPRGQTQWVRNLRTAGEGSLLLGRGRERFRAAEIPDGEKEAIMREYLRRWKWEVGQFFEGVNAKATDEQLAGIAPGFPVFRVRADH